MILSYLPRYEQTTQRQQKIEIVSRIYREIQENCGPMGGAFVKSDGQHWWEVSETTAREKITASFRNILCDRYKSSSKNKSARRRQRRGTSNDEIPVLNRDLKDEQRPEGTPSQEDIFPELPAPILNRQLSLGESVNIISEKESRFLFGRRASVLVSDDEHSESEEVVPQTISFRQESKSMKGPLRSSFVYFAGGEESDALEIINTKSFEGFAMDDMTTGDFEFFADL